MLAIQHFNVSFDAPDVQLSAIPEDLSFNEMESVLEIFTEECLNIENAIAEYDEQNEGGSRDTKVKIVLIFEEIGPQRVKLPPLLTASGLGYTGEEIVRSQYIGEISSPPPQQT